MTERPNPSIVDQAADLLVFGPIGLLHDRSVVLPDLASRGRAAVRNHLTLARFIGEFAVRRGERWVSNWADQQRVALADLKANGNASGNGDGPVSGGMASPAVSPEPAEQHIPVTRTRSASAPADGAPVPAAADLALHDYDSLAATQVIAGLDGLSAAERAAIGRYEAAHRGRRTILGKIAQLT